MGPQLDSCGRRGSQALRDLPDEALQWGRNLTVAEGRMSSLMSAVARVLLQWGRNLTVAEGQERERRRAARSQLQWGRNLTVAEGGAAPATCGRQSRFNGAAT